MTYGATAWPNHRHNDLPESEFIGGSWRAASCRMTEVSGKAT